MRYSHSRNERIEARLNRAADLAEQKSYFSTRRQPRTKKGRIAQALADQQHMADTLRTAIERGCNPFGTPWTPEYRTIQEGYLATAEAEIARLSAA